MSLADVKAKARKPLHDFMSRAASFYEDGSDSPSDPSITARRHDVPKMVGDLAGTNLSYAETHERPTTVVLWRDQLTTAGVQVRRGALIIFTATEGWHVDTVLPPDNQTVTVEVTPLSAADLNGKQLPDGTVIGA